MANHVENYIHITANEECLKEFDNLFANYGEEIERPSYHGDGTIKVWEFKEIQKHPFLEGYSDDNWYDWGCENVGAKWAHIEYAEEEGQFVHIQSAWSPVLPYCDKLYEHLRKIDDKVQIRCNYEDEFRNFVGKSIWEDGAEHNEEIDDGDINVMTENKFGEIDADFEWWEFNEKHDCVPGEWLDDLIIGWFDKEFST